jgi:hypothetical protein
MFGLRVASDFWLPLAPTGEADYAAADVWFRRGGSSDLARQLDGPPAAEVRCEHGTPMVARFDRPEGAWVRNPGIGAFHFRLDSQTVDIYPDLGADQRHLQLLLVGQVPVMLLHQRGRASLHASAVATARGAIAFLGRHGRGKSTMAAAFLRRGATLLTDDVMPLSIHEGMVYACPGAPLVKLWSETATWALGLSAEAVGQLPDAEKKLIAAGHHYESVRAPLPLRAVYLLERYEPDQASGQTIESRPLGKLETLTTLLAQQSWAGLIPPAQAARTLPLLARLVQQAPARVLRFPSGEAYIEAVYRRVMADLEAA